MCKPIALVMILMLCFSCAKKQTKLVLLPQEDGTTGAVSMTTKDSAVTLDKPYMVSQSGSMEVALADPDAINKEYGSLFKMELKRPPEPEKPPVKFILYFQNSTTNLTDQSRAKLPEIYKLLREMPPTRIQILGFTDTVGSREENLTLSTRRADCMARLLNVKDGKTNRMEVRGYGEYSLEITTPDETPEPRNRRVEIYIYPPL